MFAYAFCYMRSISDVITSNYYFEVTFTADLLSQNPWQFLSIIQKPNIYTGFITVDAGTETNLNWLYNTDFLWNLDKASSEELAQNDHLSQAYFISVCWNDHFAVISVMLSLLFSYSPSYVVTFPAENICISLTSEALIPVPNSVYHEVIETLASLLPAASHTAGTGRQGSYTWGFLLVFHPSSCIFPQACSLLFGNLK